MSSLDSREDTQGKEYQEAVIVGATLEAASQTLNDCPLFCPGMDVTWTASLRLYPLAYWVLPMGNPEE